MRALKKKPLKPLKRKIHLPDGIWTYDFHSASHIKIRNPSLDTTYGVNAPTLTGLSWNEIERGARKRWLHLTPSLVKEYIVNNISNPSLSTT